MVGATYRNLNKPELALPFLIQSIYLDPEHEYSWGNLAMCLEQLNYHRVSNILDYMEEESNKKSWSYNKVLTLKENLNK